jgi:hypothetical protein
MTIETEEAALQPATSVSAPRKSWREQRWERRRKRRLYEEVLGWLLVPTIVFGCYWAIDAALGALGTSPAAFIQGVQTIFANH